MISNIILEGNCIEILKKLECNTIDLVYLDPPFFTQKNHSLTDCKNNKYSFSDKFNDLNEYLHMIKNALIECKRVLKDTGSIFLHCDKTASHHLRVIMDEVLENKNFQSEIIWTYKRWSNSKKGLLSSHQTIFFYSISSNFQFHNLYTNYSETTNIDQILQERQRTKNGKTTYKKNDDGDIVQVKQKRGVPLSDVWEIPFLNPKAKERVGYPTQKPVSLLEQIIKIASCEGDTVLDPFCGSGTTCIAAKLLNRNYIGIDISSEAVKLANKRLEAMIITESKLLAIGKEAYIEKSDLELAILKSINAIPVQRNTLIDGFLPNGLAPVRIQKKHETVSDSLVLLDEYLVKKKLNLGILIQTTENDIKPLFEFNSNRVKIIKNLELQI
ncbi:MAG: site-specific DNA-methyltransferase [bacterium]